jgi:hypothetical protein
MNASQTRRAHRIGRASAEDLLDGAPASSVGPDDRLARLLTAAAAPARAGELAGEEAAVAAFTAEQFFPAEPAGPAPRRSPLSKVHGLRLLGLAAACGSAGVALAAATGVFSGSSPPRPSTPATRPSVTAAGPASRAAASSGTSAGTRAASPGTSAPASAGSTVPALTTQLTGLCTEVARQIAAPNSGTAGSSLSVTRLEQALASPAVAGVLTSPAFTPLTAVTGGAAGVPDFCAILLGLPQLPAPGLVSSLPVTALARVPVAVLGHLSVPVLSELPPSVLAKLPSSVLATLPPSVLATLPSSVLATLPPSVLASLPPAVLGTLPSSVLARLPLSVLAQLPSSVLAKLPPSVLSGLPPSVLSQLPSSVQSSLPASVQSELGLG